MYRHVVQYYETDRMGITHHSNYVRWMEEARIHFLDQIGWDYAKLEEMGLVSPVVSVSCRYRTGALQTALRKIPQIFRKIAAFY